MKPRLLTGFTITATLIFPCSSDRSLKLFAEATNQWLGDSLCSLTKPHLQYITIAAIVTFPCFLQTFIDFIVFIVILQIPSLVSFRFLWYKKKQLISCTGQFCFLYGISSVLLFLLSFLRYNPLSSLNFCIMRISISSVTLSLLDCSSCVLLCNWTRWL